jgi:hypothetical protein
MLEIAEWICFGLKKYPASLILSIIQTCLAVGLLFLNGFAILDIACGVACLCLSVHYKGIQDKENEKAEEQKRLDYAAQLRAQGYGPKEGTDETQN